jgi:hypothetical protein
MENRNTFNELSLRNKTTLLEDLGQELCSIEFYDHRIQLYAFENLLVEVFQNIESKEIERITTADYGNLDKYLMRITFEPFSPSKGKAQFGSAGY